MYFFKETEKAKLLQGRTIKYLAKEKLHITPEYLCQILKRKRGCSLMLAYNIVHCISWDAKLEDYFERKED